LCALPIEHVEETMRPLAVDAMAGAPSFVRGIAVVRGVPTPVVDASSLLSGHASHPTRFVTLKTARRRIALAVDAVVGVVEIPPGSLSPLPPLFQNDSSDAVSAVGTLDVDLLLVLESARLIPEELWAVLEGGCVLA
jgi:purine-binding chemotaxis protein CheW